MGSAPDATTRQRNASSGGGSVAAATRRAAHLARQAEDEELMAVAEGEMAAMAAAMEADMAAEEGGQVGGEDLIMLHVRPCAQSEPSNYITVTSCLGRRSRVQAVGSQCTGNRRKWTQPMGGLYHTSI